MAALSCYQPWRSHLAQPARCLEEDDLPPPLTIRRRQFLERCYESRSPRYRETAPPETNVVSVKKTREELTKNAVQAQAFNRRLTIESGWSKVEEVRKKFEGAAAAAAAQGSFSRSFESPPRRRLADSLFCSFKLPRKKPADMSAAAQRQPKRQSAVELLAATKAFYVKSETVLDRKQELPLRVSSGLSQAIQAGGCHLVSSSTLNNDACCNPYGTTARGLAASRRAASAGEGLQSTLRRLLEHADSREHVYSPPVYAVPHKVYGEPRRQKESYEPARHGALSGTLSGTSSSGTSGSRARASPDRRDGKLNRPRSFGDARVFFPDSFVIPRRRAEEIVRDTVNIPSPHSSPDSIQQELSDHIGAISPPAMYAHSTHRYTRSNSHSQPSIRDDDGEVNINSHKSLPDLHTQTRCYPEHVVVECGTGTVGRSPRRRRHSAHQRTASCSSKGTRSNHSSLLSSCEAFSEHPSPGEDTYPYNSRCGSSFARDSGGSSGHYTQRSAPPLARQQHRDSGSSTQHEQASRYNSYYCGGAAECYVSAPPQFQDGAPPPPPPAHPPPPPAHPPPHPPTVGIHFQASAPPPQFQDEPPLYSYEYECAYNTPAKCRPVRQERDYRDYRDTRYHAPAEVISKQPLYAEPRARPRGEDTQDYVNAPQPTGIEEVTSPLGTFKRQRCLRYKQRRPRPVLRSKSDISDRYRRPDPRGAHTAPCEPADSPESLSSSSERLQHFFEHLGLEARQFDHLLTNSDPDSPVFFTSCSSVDSNLMPDYTVQGPPTKPIYRNTEPPSVVERNARIVKWLCQCRKTLTQPQH